MSTNNLNTNGQPAELSESRDTYALSLQKSCGEVVQRIRNSTMLVNAEWASPLTAAPNAIAIMAICLKTAADKEVADLEMTELEVKDIKGNVLGSLPSTFFHTNLQHCSDVGRLAFLDAQKRMNSLRSIAKTIIADEGRISYIIDLLEDIEDAKDNLKPEMDALAKTAKDCQMNAEEITKKFEYWESVIIHLKQCSLTHKGIVVQKQKAHTVKKDHADAQRVKWAGEREQAERESRNLQHLLKEAQGNVKRAQRRLDTLLMMPAPEQPSAWEDVAYAERFVTDMGPTSRGERGFFGNVKTFFAGTSEAEIAADKNHQKAYLDDKAKRQQDAIDKVREAREEQRRTAQVEVDRAREHERAVLEDLDKAIEKISGSDHRINEAKFNLAETAAEIARLGTEKLELEGIMRILEESTRRLTDLKREVEQMVVFFSMMLEEINTTVTAHLEGFLNPIKRGIKTGPEDEMKALKLRASSKKHIMENAFELQGRFSAIADISALYVQVSNEYIRPGINMMERLATLSDTEYQSEKLVFNQWCDESVSAINQIAERGNGDMRRNMTNRVGALQKRAIEARESED